MSKLSYLKNLTKSHHTGLEICTIESLLNIIPQAAIIVNPATQKVVCANIQASELTAYARADLIDLSLHQLLLPAETTPLASYLDGSSLPEIHPELLCEILHHNGTRIPAVLSTTRLVSSENLTLITLSTQEDVLHSSLAAQRQRNLWPALNQLLIAYMQSDLPAALQQVLSNALALSGASALSIYLADGQSPTLHQAAKLDPAAALPEAIPPQDLGILNHACLWLNGKRPQTTLHRQARFANLTYTASAPIGEANTTIGVFTVAGTGEPPDSIQEIVLFLANQIYFHIQSNTLITQLQNNLAAFRLQRLGCDMVFDSIDDGLIFLTPERQILRLNTAAELALGYTNPEVQDLSIINVLICNENLETTFRFVAEELHPSSLSSLRLYRRNGDSFLASLRVMPIVANGDLDSILVLFHDQSEQEEYKTRNQMLEQRANLADITASFAHEVRNPINNISTGLQLLALHLSQDDPNQENICRLQNDCERLADLVKSGLSFVRPVEYKLEPVDLGKVITNLMDRWRNRLARTQVKYNPQIEANIPTVEGDLRALEQVFTNLIDNAIQAMEAVGGVLTINIRHIGEAGERSHVEVNILDNGPGIPPEAREHIFEPFFTTKRSGTGLGLAIVKRIVTAHKGSIHVSSIPGGTMFRVRIPCI
jgi:two-component system sensor histidine kinase AtoS